MDRNKRPPRISQCFRTAFDFLTERTNTLQHVGNTAGFWDATAEIATFKANQSENEPLLLDLLAICTEDLERQARTMERKRSGIR